MTSPYPDSTYLQGNYAPLRMECDATDLIVEGEIPQDLYGAFFRNGPNPQFPPLGDYHWFSGDGMIHAFYFENGKVSYKNRWVQTIKWKLEREAGRSLFTAYSTTPSDPSVKDVELDGRGNVNLVSFGEQLLALEGNKPPIIIDPVTLATGKQETFGGDLLGTTSAHPKIDPETGEMLIFAQNTSGSLSDDMSFQIVSPDGQVTRSELFKTPYPALLHDFATTRNYAIFPIMPLVGSIERARNGQSAYAWEPERGAHIGILPRHGELEDMRWFKGDQGYVYHLLNAYEDGDKIICDVFEFDEAPLFPRADGKPSLRERWIPRLVRWHFDIKSNTDDYKRELLDDLPCEFGRIDERRAGLPYRYGYFGADTLHQYGTGQFNAIGRRDHELEKTDLFISKSGCIMEEPVFVPKNKSGSEEDGYIISMMYDASSNTSSLGLFDAALISDGPIARVRLDHRVPFGFHGYWCSGVSAAA